MVLRHHRDNTAAGGGVVHFLLPTNATDAMGLFGTDGFVVITFTAAWTGMKVLRFSSKPLKSMFRWSRVSAIGASIVGATAAIDAVISRDKNNGDVVYSLIAAGGVMLSWALLHIGFAQIYQVVDLQSHAFSFQGRNIIRKHC